VIFEVKTKCPVEPRYVGIQQISTKGVKKNGKHMDKKELD
jgi:hypothetical protein